jgi:phospholipid/cholesterol/gamma-HCH transport system substrate-binding protein
MERNGRLSLVVGAFVIACLGAFAVAVLSLSSEKGIFVEQYTLVAHFENVQGLLPGAPVWLAGKSVGRVAEVGFSSQRRGSPLRVVLKVDESVGGRIRGDSKASIGTIGVLGDSYVEVSVGAMEVPALSPGDEIEVLNPTNLYEVMARASSAMDSISVLAEDLDKEILTKGSDALSSITALAESMDKVVGSFEEEGGGRKAADAIAAVSGIMIAIEEGDGLLHNLIFDESTGDGVHAAKRSLDSLENVLGQLENIMGEVKEGNGLVHSLIYGAPGERDVVMEFIEAGARLNNILAKVDEGNGTIGLMINDPTLFEDLKILLGGAQRSTVVRTLVRMAIDADS